MSESTTDFKARIARLIGGYNERIRRTDAAIVRTRQDRGYYPPVNKKAVARISKRANVELER